MLRSSALSILRGSSGALGALQAAVSEACGTSFAASREESCWQQRGLSTEAAAVAPGIPACPSVYAAVVLERLPVVQRPPPEWEAEYNAWAEQRRLQGSFYKQYPASTSKGRQKEDETETFTPVPIETAADRSGDTSTMKRQLREKLILLVKQKGSVLGSGKASSGGGWAFPHVQHQEGETLRAAAERALRECAGVAEVFFIGNAPMAHYPLDGSSSSSSGTVAASSSGSDAPAGTRALSTTSGASAAAAAAAASTEVPSSVPSVFFMLAQVVNDPWELTLQPAFASDAAWVTVEELPQYLGDDRLAELARQML